MFHIKRIVCVIITPAVNKNTPPWLGEGVSQHWSSKRKKKLHGFKCPFPSRTTVQGPWKLKLDLRNS